MQKLKGCDRNKTACMRLVCPWSNCLWMFYGCVPHCSHWAGKGFGISPETKMYMRTQNNESAPSTKTMYYILVAFVAISILAQLLVKVLEH